MDRTLGRLNIMVTNLGLPDPMAVDLVEVELSV